MAACARALGIHESTLGRRLKGALSSPEAQSVTQRIRNALLRHISRLPTNPSQSRIKGGFSGARIYLTDVRKVLQKESYHCLHKPGLLAIWKPQDGYSHPQEAQLKQ